jgi:hypothetical protein
VVVTWTEPDNGGSPITGYKVSFKQSETNWITESVNCDMTSSTLTTCTIPVTTFTTYFSLDWGSSIYAKVIATNNYGDSLESLEGNGAVITTTPDPPTNLIEDYAQRTKSTLGL